MIPILSVFLGTTFFALIALDIFVRKKYQQKSNATSLRKLFPRRSEQSYTEESNYIAPRPIYDSIPDLKIPDNHERYYKVAYPDSLLANET